MHRICARLVSALLLLSLVGTACSATADVTLAPGLVEQAAAQATADLAAATADDEAASAAEPEAPTSGALTSTEAGSTATATSRAAASAATTQASDSLEAEQAEKAERRAAHDAFLRELYATLHGSEPRLETDRLPDQAALAAAATGETMRTTATVELIGEANDPIVFVTQSNETGGVTHTIAERDDYARLLAARFNRGDASAANDPGPFETVAIINGGYTVWSRGLTPEIASTAYAPLDPDRWYVADAVSSAVRPFYGTTSEVWERLNTPMPDATFNEDGTSVRLAPLAEPRMTSAFGFAAANPDAVPATLTTVTNADDQLIAIEVVFEGDDALAQVRFDISDRGAPLELPNIVDVLEDPRDTRSIPADSYSWTATGTTFEVDGDLEDSRWNVQGHYADAYLNDILTMTAGDAAKLASVTLDQTPPDRLIQRKGFEGTTYTVGLAPEILPAWANPNIDPGAEYFNDVFGVPTHIFPMGLSEYSIWSSLRTLPSIEERRGWNHARVTVGSVDPDYWNWRHRQTDGFFAWILSEDPAEQFEVTIGADADGRVERFELRTLDPDGGGLRFDITIDAVKTEPPFVEVTARPTNLTVDPAWAEASVEAEEAEAAPDIEAFFAASRAAYPTIEHARRPEHLTLLAVRVRDEPSGAYTPEGEFYRWPSVYFDDLVVGSLGDTGQMIVCLELEDNEWRFADNDFEKFWRGYADGSSLDGLTLRYNANAWLSVDVYGSDGERHAADPCALAGSW